MLQLNVVICMSSIALISGMWTLQFMVVPRHNLSRRAFAVAGPAAWNSLSDDLRNPALSTDSFRRLLKTRLFSEYKYIQRIRGIMRYINSRLT